MIWRSFKLFHQKHANGFVPLPYQPESNDRSGGHPCLP
jgi:tRNA(Met) C34 N-acetyltransferase TmcA